jgi:hypothetical protein
MEQNTKFDLSEYIIDYQFLKDVYVCLFNFLRGDTLAIIKKSALYEHAEQQVKNSLKWCIEIMGILAVEISKNQTKELLEFGKKVMVLTDEIQALLDYIKHE